jgi:hypothetical protein
MEGPFKDSDIVVVRCQPLWCEDLLRYLPLLRESAPPPVMLPAASPPLPSGGRGCLSPPAYTQLPSPRITASPSLGVDGRSQQECRTQQQVPTLPASPRLSCAAPSWASIDRDGARLRTSPLSTQTSDVVTRGDFVALYELKFDIGGSDFNPSPISFTIKCRTVCPPMENSEIFATVSCRCAPASQVESIMPVVYQERGFT